MNNFLKEILEQPIALENTLSYYTSIEGENVLLKIANVISTNNFEQIIFTGMGSSYFTSYAASKLFNELEIQIPSFVVNASELLHYEMSLLNKKTLLICFSQSGESFEIKELLKVIPAHVYCLGISNEEDSTLAKTADITLLSKAGVEKMTSTKSYISTTLVSFILGWHLSGKWNLERIDSIKNLINNFKVSLENYDLWVNNMIAFLGEFQTLSIIARGPGASTAFQSGLMFKETTKISAYGILGGEFRHGPMEMVQEGFKCILFVSRGKTMKQGVKMAEDIIRFGGKVVLITNGQIDIDNDNILIISINEQDEFLFSIQSIIPIQLFIDSYTKQRGFEAGDFSHGSKVTEIE